MTPYRVTSGATWQAPDWAVVPTSPIDVRACRSCRAPIAWLRAAASGRLAPLNQDGTSHFSTCPQSDQWRKPR